MASSGVEWVGLGSSTGCTGLRGWPPQNPVHPVVGLDRLVDICDDFGGAAVSQPPKSKARNVSIVHSNLFGAWKATLLWLRPPAAVGKVVAGVPARRLGTVFRPSTGTETCCHTD